MTENVTIGQYFPGNSVLHHLDPRVKILSVILFVAAVFMMENMTESSLLICYTIILAGLSRIPGKFLVRGLKPLWWIAVFTLGLHFFFTEGTIIWQWRFLTLTLEGLRQGIFVTLRLVLLIFMASLLTLTTSPISLTDGLERLLSLLRPLGVPAHEIALMMTIALRFIPTLLQETDKIIKAQTSRGADFSSGNMIARLKNLVPIVVPLFVNAFRRADELAVAMEARCYRGGQGRTRMREMKIGTGDMAALLIAGGLIAGIYLLRG
ncbi:MAG: energy-coupling factor transporter transmembrane component T [Bacillota bacterium]|nr:energy-coupling factor transporter transmembrane component T [Negativicutes bacterium]